MFLYCILLVGAFVVGIVANFSVSLGEKMDRGDHLSFAEVVPCYVLSFSYVTMSMREVNDVGFSYFYFVRVANNCVCVRILIYWRRLLCVQNAVGE